MWDDEADFLEKNGVIDEFIGIGESSVFHFQIIQIEYVWRSLCGICFFFGDAVGYIKIDQITEIKQAVILNCSSCWMDDLQLLNVKLVL